MHGRIILSLACLACCAGCTETPAPAEPSDIPTTLGQSFDPAATGGIHGRVVWNGDIPAGEEVLIRAIAFNPHLYKNPARVVTPHLPRVNPKNRGVANAVVCLRGIEPQRSKPWDHPVVRIEFQGRQLLIRQGVQHTGVGFLRRGAAVEIVNHDAEYHNLRARGAAFFAMPLIEANQVHERKLTQAGLVDLTCGAGYYWLHAHLFVVEHPYYTLTDGDGNFTLAQVPDGEYEIVCWHPHWHVARKEVDPETAIIARQIWSDPLQQVRPIRVHAAADQETVFHLSRP